MHFDVSDIMKRA